MNQPNEYAAFVGIDWADQHHDYCWRTPDSGVCEQGRIEHTPVAVAQWAEGARQRFGGRPVAVSLEQSRGPLIYALMRHPFLVLYPRTSTPTRLAPVHGSIASKRSERPERGVNAGRTAS